MTESAGVILLHGWAINLDSLGVSMAQFRDLLQEVKGITLMSLEDLGQAVGSEDRSALLDVFLGQEITIRLRY